MLIAITLRVNDCAVMEAYHFDKHCLVFPYRKDFVRSRCELTIAQ